MALLDLSLVTRSLVNLIREHVTSSPAWPTSATVTVSPEPPDKLEGDNTIGLYLYHITEDAHFKNLPAPGNDPTPVRHTPMALNLYYLLSAHSDLSDATGPYREQLMMGCALKALRDFPTIDETTEINGAKILDSLLVGGDNRLRIVLRPVPPEEAPTYWTARSSPLRLAAYYQVSVVLLEPEESRYRAGRVLVYGVHTFVGGAPHLDGSRNLVPFTIPGQVGSREVELRPAQTPPAPPSPAQTPAASTVTFTGSNLTGDDTHLRLKNARWDVPVEAGPAWSIAAREDRITAVVQQTAGVVDILPGIYAALVKVVRRRTMPDGTVREFEHTSNEAPFVITPRIDTIAEAGGLVTVSGYVFQHAELLPESVQVYVGDARLVAGTAGSLSDGEFAVVDASTLELRLPPGHASGKALLFRLFVNGAESAPHWIPVP